MIKRFWQALNTWLMLAEAFEASCMSSEINMNAKWELLKEKFRRQDSQSLRILPSGFGIRKNRSDMNVLISMGYEYNLLEWNFRGKSLTVVDAGANIGSFAFYLNCFCDIKKYIGIEAAPKNVAVLKRNLSKLGSNFSPIQCFLTDESKGGVFNLKGTPSRFGKSDVGERLPGLPLDDVISMEKNGVIDILKIDVEGGELDVVKGARKTLAKTKYVVMEIHHVQLGFEGVKKIFEIMERDFYYITYQKSPDMQQSNIFFWRKNTPPPLC